MDFQGFTRLTADYKYRIIAGLYGTWRTGKSHMALTAPDPILIFNTDMSLEGVVEKFVAAGKEILANRYTIPLEIRQISELLSTKTKDQEVAMPLHFNWREATEIWAQYAADWERALASSARTIILDTFTEAIELLRVARFGKLTQVEKFHYYPVYTEIRQFMKMAEASNKNVLFIFKMREQYRGGESTGEMIPDAIPRMEHLVQVMIEMGREVTEDKKLGRFYASIKDCRQNSALAGVTLWQPCCDFPTLGTMIYPGTKLEQWR